MFMGLMKVSNRVSLCVVFVCVSFMPIGIAHKNHNVLLHEMDLFLYYLTVQTLSIKKEKRKLEK
jgi:hypothetical protein